jgi:hypothetical protein
VVTDTASIVRDVRNYVSKLATPSRRMTQKDLDYAKDVYATGKGRGTPKGTDAGGPVRTSPPFPRLANPRLHVADGWNGPYTKAAQRAVAETKSQARRGAGLVREYEIEPLAWPVESPTVFKPNDLIVWVDPEFDDDSDVYLCEVETEPRLVGKERLYWLRLRASQEPLLLTEVDKALKAKGYASGLGKFDRFVRSTQMKQAILKLFDAPSG